MSEPIPESIPTSMDRRSRRPTKRLRQTDSTPTSLQAATLSHLFSNPSREINIPSIPSPSDPSSSSSIALGAPNAKTSSKPPPEIVHNVQGSSAGAGSGEFHVYKASRRREYERLRGMDEEVRMERVEEEWERGREEREERDRERTRRNREKRSKKKGGKVGGGCGEKGEKDGKEGKDGAGGKVQRRVENTDGERDGDKNGGERANGDGDGDGDEGVAQEVGVIIHDDD